MERVNEILKSMDFTFFGSGKHKILPSQHLTEKNSLFLDVRSKEECETIAFSLVHHMPVLHIPINEVPDRVAEIPRDKIVGVFCSSGVRSTMVYLYLRSLGFDKVRIIEGGYSELVEELKPGKLLKAFENRTPENEGK
ncbi:MAG: rhodanese-like domain-containing protein [Spirochaetes bacterium]|nr:rhodanese-like domain-containing protein [Spirochaetota bacterium]